MLALYIRIKAYIDSMNADESGASAAEYAVLVAFIAIAIIVAVTAFGTALSNTFTTLAGKLPG